MNKIVLCLFSIVVFSLVVAPAFAVTMMADVEQEYLISNETNADIDYVFDLPFNGVALGYVNGQILVKVNPGTGGTGSLTVDGILINDSITTSSTFNISDYFDDNARKLNTLTINYTETGASSAGTVYLNISASDIGLDPDNVLLNKTDTVNTTATPSVIISDTYGEHNYTVNSTFDVNFAQTNIPIKITSNITMIEDMNWNQEYGDFETCRLTGKVLGVSISGGSAKVAVANEGLGTELKNCTVSINGNSSSQFDLGKGEVKIVDVPDVNIASCLNFDNVTLTCNLSSNMSCQQTWYAELGMDNLYIDGCACDNAFYTTDYIAKNIGVIYDKSSTTGGCSSGSSNQTTPSLTATYEKFGPYVINAPSVASKNGSVYSVNYTVASADDLINMVNWTVDLSGFSKFNYETLKLLINGEEKNWTRGSVTFTGQNLSAGTNYIYYQWFYTAPAGGSGGASPGYIASPVCGNGICEAGETAVNCPQDCVLPFEKKVICGDGICDSPEENQHNCPQDCAIPIKIQSQGNAGGLPVDKGTLTGVVILIVVVILAVIIVRA